MLDKPKNRAKTVSVPFQAVEDLYHDILCPPMSRCLKLTDKRKSQIRRLWNTDLTDLEKWANFFNDCKGADWLMGKIPPTNGHKQFQGSLEWITNYSNFIKIAEGKYHEPVI
jgi:hypothetical protein